ncbi:uncharacterized protein LOC116427708 isoform X2 [Nomia melanderi]|nr:uncharacterized protein LOC116427708 isoform X2 [Nomia melanderi]XP_031834234.1 uncharacterized protein LOC116427708 isoform X2 [Nomia melanderi]XP_031834235.1 uncharacterized protein LOC116427708 isoform X2 [Nomia melanderi]XP_031834236.1 uncharacterized protein LOC116427708 isoform X2 [Nomia melanderi]XP_031834237.1 uncharacterized protein LOC116427708 isoform X2 [Nomia melanderi]XP_031834238.1 uncharacterized protein LOC116427708 isoform X2 [Nomia melanderi]XP_031834239.1 uncharacterize
MSTSEKVSSVKVTSKVPILRITINKMYNKPYTSELDENKLTANTISSTDNIVKIEENNMIEKRDTNSTNCMQSVASSKPILFNLIPVVFEKPIKCKDTCTETKNTHVPKVAYTRRGDLSRDTRNQTISERIKYLHTKAQRDCDILRIRLKALRERHKQEKIEIAKLETYLSELSKHKSINVISGRHLKRKKLFVSLKDTEEDECQKLLRKVRKIKDEILKSRCPITAAKRNLEQVNALNHNANIVNEVHNNSTVPSDKIQKPAENCLRTDT